MRDMPSGLQKFVVLALLWLAGFYMRVPILAAAPLGPVINDELGLSQASLGALTTLPVLMLGLGALPASMLIGKIGARNTLVAAVTLAAIGSGLRGLSPDLFMLLAATAVMGLGIAAMQPALPALVPRWCPGFIALGSTVYMNGMLMGEFAGAGLTLPLIMPLVGGDWRAAFLLWSVPALLVALALFYPRLHGQRARALTQRWLPAWHDRQVWVFGLLLGTTAATFFGVNAYMGSVLAEKGMSEYLVPALFVFNLAQVLSSALMLAAARRMLRMPRLLFVTVALTTIGLIGFMLLGNVISLVAAVVLSFASALQLIALVTLPPLLRGADDAGKLAAGMFAVGYVLAFLIPLGAGAIADTLGSTQAALWLIVVFNLVCLPLAWKTRVDNVV